MTEAAKVIPIDIRKLNRINMPLPPAHLFDDLLGCHNNKRLFALYWSRKAQVPILNDGNLEIVGTLEPYRIWRYHPKIIVALSGYNIGDTGDFADHWLLMDRKTRMLYIGDIADVLLVLDYQKRGIIAPLPETETYRQAGEPRTQMPGDPFISTKKFRKQTTLSLKRIHELEAWLDVSCRAF
jgi:hypothetical protein